MAEGFKKWALLGAFSGIIHGAGFKALETAGEKWNKEHNEKNQKTDGLVQVEPGISENDFEDKVEAAITDEEGNIDEKKIKKIDTGMMMIDFLISSGDISLEKGEALKKILEAKRSEYRELAKTKNQLEVLHHIIQEHRKYDPAVAGLDNFLETGTGDCEGAATGILAITQGVYPDIEMHFQEFAGAYGGHIRLVARIDGQWFSLERSTPTPITFEKGTVTTPVTDLVKVMAGKTVASKENGIAENPFDGKVAADSPNGSNPVVAKLIAHNNGARPTALYGKDEKPTVLEPFSNITLEAAQAQMAQGNPYAAEIAMRIARELQEELAEKPKTKANQSPNETRQRMEIRLVEQNKEQVIKDKILIGLHEIMLKTEDAKERQAEITKLFRDALKYGMLIDDLRADKKTKILQNPEVRAGLEHVLFQETLLAIWPNQILSARTVANIVRNHKRFVQWNVSEKIHKLTMVQGTFHSEYGKYPTKADVDIFAEILENYTYDDADLHIDATDPERLRFSGELLVKMQKKIKHVYIHIDQTSDLSALVQVFELITTDIKVSIVPTEKEILKVIKEGAKVMLSEKDLSFIDSIPGIVEIAPSILIYGDEIPLVNPKIVKPLNLNDISLNENLSAEEYGTQVKKEVEENIVSILQGEKILIKMDFDVPLDILDKVMLDPRIKKRKPDFLIDDIFQCAPELLQKLASYDIGKLTIHAYHPGSIDLSVFKQGEFDLEFEPDMFKMEFNPANYTLTVTAKEVHP